MLKWIILISAVILCHFNCLAFEEKADDGGMKISLQRALLIALENNVSLRIQQLNPAIVEKNEAIARAQFDTGISLGAGVDYDEIETVAGDVRSADDTSADLGLSKRFSTGTKIDVGFDLKRDQTTSANLEAKRHTDSVSSELRITQSLLKGRGPGANLANVRRAEINTAISKQQLRRYIETLIYNVTIAYWNLFLEREKLTVYQESYDLALDHENEVEVFIRNGRLPEIERSTVKGEVSSRRERLIQARGAIEKARLNLIGTTNLYGLPEGGWDKLIIPIDDPKDKFDEPGEVSSYVEIALLKRPEILEADLKLRREDVELVATKNGLLPKLDFFIGMGRTEYSNAFYNGDETENDDHSLSAGLEYSMSLGRRAERARVEQGTLNKEQAALALANLKDSINQEVRRSYIDCITDLETIEAVSVTQSLRSQSLKTQTIKFELGEATNTDIANAQRDLLQSQINHTVAVIDYVKSRLRLHYLDGSLIERSGIAIP